MKRPHTVVIIEDELLLAHALTDLVEDLGFQVLDIASTEEKAVEMVLRLRPDVVLMDIKLAEHGSGISAARSIRQQLNVPIIFCTSYSDSPDVQQNVQVLGNTAIIGKPFDNTQLATLLAQVVARGARPSGWSARALVAL